MNSETTTNQKYAPVTYRRKEFVLPVKTAVITEDMTEVQRRKAMFEELAGFNSYDGPKKIRIKKGYGADMSAEQGSKYGKKFLGISSLPPKKTLAELP